MSNFDKHSNPDFSIFNNMTTEELQEILRQDSHLDISEESEMDAVIYIMEVLAERKAQSQTGNCDTDAAWDSFNRNYRPCEDGAASLYGGEDEGGKVYCNIRKPSAENAVYEKSDADNGRRHTRRFSRTFMVAAVVIIITLLGTFAVSARGYNVWGSVARWTSENFTFGRPNEQASFIIPGQLSDMEEGMNKLGAATSLLPTYIPDGYEVIEFQADVWNASTDFYCMLGKEDSYFSITYRVYSSGSFSSQFEKSNSNPEIYEKNGITYYIIMNMDKYNAVWTYGNVECSILGLESREELIKIVDSIKGEKQN